MKFSGRSMISRRLLWWCFNDMWMPLSPYTQISEVSWAPLCPWERIITTSHMQSLNTTEAELVAADDMTLDNSLD
jgi:hypothetical protein